jgi:hypothetical protein
MLFELKRGESGLGIVDRRKRKRRAHFARIGFVQKEC